MNRRNEVGTTAPDGRSWGDQPRWRRDFPIDSEEDEYVSRRDFTRFMVVISGAFAIGQAWIVTQNFFRRRRGLAPIQEIGRLSQLPVGGVLTFRYPSERESCVLVRLAEDDLVAYEQACTHLSCPVIPRVRERIFECPCHNGSFSMETGDPIAGPPRRRLAGIHIQVRDDRIYALGVF